MRFGHPAQAAALPASSAAGPTHPSFAFSGMFEADAGADGGEADCRDVEGGIGLFEESAMAHTG